MFKRQCPKQNRYLQPPKTLKMRCRQQSMAHLQITCLGRHNEISITHTHTLFDTICNCITLSWTPKLHETVTSHHQEWDNILSHLPLSLTDPWTSLVLAGTLAIIDPEEAYRRPLGGHNSEGSMLILLGYCSTTHGAPQIAEHQLAIVTRYYKYGIYTLYLYRYVCMRTIMYHHNYIICIYRSCPI